MKRYGSCLLIILLSLSFVGCSGQGEEKTLKNEVAESMLQSMGVDSTNTGEVSSGISYMPPLLVADIRSADEWDLFINLRDMSETDFLKISEGGKLFFSNAYFGYYDYQRMIDLLSSHAIIPFCPGLVRGIVMITPDNSSIDWSFGENSGIVCWVHVETAKERITEFIQETAKQNQFTLEKIEHAVFDQLYYCNKTDDNQKYSKLEYYYGEINGLFVCVSFARAAKKECDTIIKTISFKPVEENPFR